MVNKRMYAVIEDRRKNGDIFYRAIESHRVVDGVKVVYSTTIMKKAVKEAARLNGSKREQTDFN